MFPRRFAALVMHDVRLQFRYGIHFAYAFVVAFYFVGLQLGGAHVPPWMKVLVLFTDPSVLGFFFLGALMMLERGENTRDALAVTPTSASEYLAAKTVSLTALSLVAIGVLSPLLHSDADTLNWPVLLLGVALTSTHFIGLGAVAACYFETVSSYLLGAGAGVTPIIAPGLLALTGPVSTGALFIPAASQVALIRVGLGDLQVSPGELALMFTVSTLAAALGAWLGRRALLKEVGG